MGEDLAYREGSGHTEDLVTPEGVPVQIVVAAAAERLIAFLIDIGIVVLSAVIIGLIGGLSSTAIGHAIGLLGVFLLRNFYFMWFEKRWGGATPGKRRVGLRVIDAHGGQLTVEAIIVRNLTREVETFMPSMVLIKPDWLWPDAPGWAQMVAGLWAAIFMLMPLLNRQRRRLGDLAAGTMVIKTPHISLLQDLTSIDVSPPGEAPREMAFSAEQLEIYGTYELQVLEDLLRAKDVPEGEEALQRVSETIQRKIGWQHGLTSHEAFLLAFYAALRRHLEQRMLLGKARERKQVDGARPDMGPTGPD